LQLQLLRFSDTSEVKFYGDSQMCLSLMTFWDADVLHLNNLENFHFSKDGGRTVGDDLCTDIGIKATANAIIMDFSLTVSDKEFHNGGKSIDNNAKFMVVNVHMPLAGLLKVRCAMQLRDRLKSYDDHFIIVSGDMNSFGDDKEFPQLISIFKDIGELSAKEIDGVFRYETLLSTEENRKMRTTTFVGMIYDLIKTMKLPIKDYDQYIKWVEGDAKVIKNEFGRDMQPLDWVISKNNKWCTIKDVRVIDILHDLKYLGFDLDEVYDYGNFITDHLPLIATVEIK
jgi:hypothetical protein